MCTFSGLFSKLLQIKLILRKQTQAIHNSAQNSSTKKIQHKTGGAAATKLRKKLLLRVNLCLYGYYPALEVLIIHINTRLLGRFAPIFYINCEHVLIVNIEKQEEKNFADFQDLKIYIL